MRAELLSVAVVVHVTIDRGRSDFAAGPVVRLAFFGLYTRFENLARSGYE